jgi:DNA-binding MarR family transcriptional regulator
VTQFYDHALAPAGLRATQFPILAWLADHGAMTMGALAEAMVMDRATLGHNLRPLEAQGLITRVPGRDRRARLVSLSAAGQQRLADARLHWRAAQERFEGAYGASRAAALRDALAQVTALLPVPHPVEQATPGGGDPG